MYDVAIIGLGPAGSTLARLLNKNLKIVAIDKKDITNIENTQGFQKPCGGLLATDAQKILSGFNLTLPVNILVDPQIFAVCTVDLKKNITRHYQRFYMNMDRHKFDLWLIKQIPQKVTIYDKAACTNIQKIENGYKITGKRNNEDFTIKAKYLVGADGASSIVRRTFFPHNKTRSYISVQEWYVDKNIRPLYSCFFDRDITDCYAWSISKNGFFILGGAFPLKDNRKLFVDLKEKLKKHGYIFGEPVKKEACMVLRPANFFDFCCGNDNIFFIGEAAGFISPSSLEGISYAFDSAKELATILNANTKNPNLIYNLRSYKIRLKLFMKNIKSIFMYVPFLRWLIMKSKLQSIKIINTD